MNRNTRFTIRLDTDLLRRVEKWRHDQDVAISRVAVFEAAIDEWLRERGG